MPWVDPTLENSPCALVELGDLPSPPPPIGEWIRLVDAHGATVPAALRWEPEGFTLIGDRLAENVDVDGLETRLLSAAPIDFPLPARPDEISLDPNEYDSRVRVYRLVDEERGTAVEPTIASDGRSVGYSAAGLDPVEVRWRVVRLRPLGV